MSDGFFYEFQTFLAERHIVWPRATVHRPLNFRTRVLAYFGIYMGPQ